MRECLYSFYEFLPFRRHHTGRPIEFFQLRLLLSFDIFASGFCLEKLLEMLQSLLRLRDDHESVRVLVEPVEESRSDEISDGRQIFVGMVEESHHRRFMHLPYRFRMGKHSFRLVDDKIIIFFQDYGYLDIRRLIEQDRGEVSADVINLHLVAVFQLIGLLHYLAVRFHSSSLDDMVKEAPGVVKLLA